MKAETTAEVVTRDLLELLKKLVESDQKFLITSHSMKELIRLYQEELLRAVGRGEGAGVLETWFYDVDSFRADWLNSPHAGQATLDGQPLRVATEWATHDAHTKCAERKQRGSPRDRGSGRRSPSPRRPATKKVRRRAAR